MSAPKQVFILRTPSGMFVTAQGGFTLEYPEAKEFAQFRAAVKAAKTVSGEVHCIKNYGLEGEEVVWSNAR